jgi:hypothetical protein
MLVRSKTSHSKDIVVMDSLSVHNIAGVQESIEVVGAEVRYLPSSSSYLNRSEAARSVSEL